MLPKMTVFRKPHIVNVLSHDCSNKTRSAVVADLADCIVENFWC